MGCSVLGDMTTGLKAAVELAGAVLPYGWLLDRKLHVLGGIVLAFQLSYLLLPDSVPTSVARWFLFGSTRYI